MNDLSGVQIYRHAGFGGASCEHVEDWVFHHHLCAPCKAEIERRRYQERREIIRAQQRAGYYRQKVPCPYCREPKQKRSRTCAKCSFMFGRTACPGESA